MLPNFQVLLYRDDGLGITNSKGRQIQKLREATIKVFKDYNLDITIQSGMVKVHFLDVTLDIEKEIFKPYRKPGDKPLYVNSLSKHPPMVLSNIPLGINKRLCGISSNEEAFLEAIPPYQTELQNCGYNHKLVWLGEGENQKKKRTRSRSKPVIWFNPPYSINVQTNVGKEFLSLLDKHFLVGHPLHGIINRNTVKISYRCMPNLGRELANHNSKTLKSHTNPTPRGPAECNCQKSRKQECPIPGGCNQDGAIYQATVATSDGREESYVGLAKNFKKRFNKHRATLKNRGTDGQTTLSKYVWEQKDLNMNPEVYWKILEKNVPNPVTNKW